jgi:hypothetical protein
VASGSPDALSAATGDALALSNGRDAGLQSMDAGTGDRASTDGAIGPQGQDAVASHTDALMAPGREAGTADGASRVGTTKASSSGCSCRVAGQRELDPSALQILLMLAGVLGASRVRIRRRR